MMLRFLLFLVLAYAALRFIRGVTGGLRGTQLPRRDAPRRSVPDLDEADIIEAEFTDVTDVPDVPEVSDVAEPADRTDSHR